MNPVPAHHGAISLAPHVPPDPGRVIFLVFAGKKHFPPPLGSDGEQAAGVDGLAGGRGGWLGWLVDGVWGGWLGWLVDGLAGWLVGLVG